MLEVGTPGNASEIVINENRPHFLVECALLPRPLEVYAVVPCIEDERTIPLIIRRNFFFCE